MADRATAAIYVAANGRDAVIYSYERDCLYVAHQIAWMIGFAGVIHVYDDDNDGWRWKSPTPHKRSGEDT